MAKKRKTPPRRNSSYEIGYGKPPKATQFQPGVSGNFSGKRKGIKNRATIVREILNSKVGMVEGGRHRRVSYSEGLLRMIADSALKHRNFKYVHLFLNLAEEVEAADRRRVERDSLVCTIDPSMTAKEAAEEYAKSLTLIRGLIEPDWEIDDS